MTQTAAEDGRNLVKISGRALFNEGNEVEGARTPMPETGDEAMPVLWSVMLLTAAGYFVSRKRAKA